MAHTDFMRVSIKNKIKKPIFNHGSLQLDYVHNLHSIKDALLTEQVMLSSYFVWSRKIIRLHIHRKATYAFKQVLTLGEYKVSELTCVMNSHKIPK